MRLPGPGARVVDAQDGAVLHGDALEARVVAAAAAFDDRVAGTAFQLTATTTRDVVAFLGAWRAGRAVAPLDPALPSQTVCDFVDRFEPALVIGATDAPPAGYRSTEDRALGPLWERQVPSASAVPDELGLLLTTSGSTGDPKLVRLSRHAVEANVTSIIAALEIGPDDVAITTLPLFYSFGLSVLTTHLAAGATIVIEPEGLVNRRFWESVDRHGVTSLALVPSQYEMLRRLRFDPSRHASIRTLTQAGGRLGPEAILEFHGRMASVGGRLFVMYGQTEAAPRITTLPPADLPAKVGSVGPALVRGRLSIRLANGAETTEPGLVGDVLYRGPNVMLGYAERVDDLAAGDVQAGLLETGDLGHLDADGYLYLDGRTRRIAKVFGVRLNLDDVERMAADLGAVAAVARDDGIRIWVAGPSRDFQDERVALAQRLRLHWTGIELRPIDDLPLLPNGKVDYRLLEQRA
jgi:acyl-CoA synthetase (AMP-forming)/AMP-acid ligase II